MAEQYLEVELRYKVLDVSACLERLKKEGLTVARTEHLVDEWYLPKNIASLKEEQEWFDENHGVAWRVRRATKDGVTKLETTSKQLTDDNNHNSFYETEEQYASYDDAVKAMGEREYKNWLTIDKTRYFLESSNKDIPAAEYELIIDEIAGLAEKIGVGACLEIEHKGTDGREVALSKIQSVAGSLGFSTNDQFDKSLTVVSMTELARF
jgi:adenylate cyclase class IV